MSGNNQITSTAINNANTEITLVFSSAVSNTSGGSGGLDKDDFTISISGGTATSPVISSVSNTSSTEKVLTISHTGTANGSETITVLQLLVPFF